MKEYYPDVHLLIFATPREVTKHTERLWAKEILDKFGLRLEVVPREESTATYYYYYPGDGHKYWIIGRVLNRCKAQRSQS